MNLVNGLAHNESLSSSVDRVPSRYLGITSRLSLEQYKTFSLSHTHDMMNITSFWLGVIYLFPLIGLCAPYVTISFFWGEGYGNVVAFFVACI